MKAKTKKELVKYILSNKKAREYAINGAISIGNYSLAVYLLTLK